jgi:hypothetical protein
MKSIATKTLEPMPMISHGSWGQRDKGSHASTLELWQGNDGGLSIEWDIPGLEQTEHVGLTFDADKRLVDYDGISRQQYEPERSKKPTSCASQA